MFVAERADAVVVDDAEGAVGAVVDAEDDGSSRGVAAEPLGSYCKEPT